MEPPSLLPSLQSLPNCSSVPPQLLPCPSGCLAGGVLAPGEAARVVQGLSTRFSVLLILGQLNPTGDVEGPKLQRADLSCPCIV